MVSLKQIGVSKCDDQILTDKIYFTAVQLQSPGTARRQYIKCYSCTNNHTSAIVLNVNSKDQDIFCFTFPKNILKDLFYHFNY